MDMTSRKHIKKIRKVNPGEVAICDWQKLDTDPKTVAD